MGNPFRRKKNCNRPALPVQMAIAIFLALCLGAAQTQHPVTGRRIAPVMGIGGAGWLDRGEREAEESPEAALEAIGIRAGMQIADVGAGTGYFALRIARRVGPEGRVWANDIQPEMLEILRQRARTGKLANVETVLGTDTGPRLPAGRMDLVLLVDVYHEFAHPQQMLAGIRRSLKPDGRLVLLEYRKEDPDVPIRPEHKMSVAEVKAELEPAGFRLERADESLPRQHILIFKVSVQ